MLSFKFYLTRPYFLYMLSPGDYGAYETIVETALTTLTAELRKETSDFCVNCVCDPSKNFGSYIIRS